MVNGTAWARGSGWGDEDSNGGTAEKDDEAGPSGRSVAAVIAVLWGCVSLVGRGQ